MSFLNQSIITSLGITLNDEDFQSLADHFDSTLTDRVIDQVALEITSEQAQELVALKEADDDTVVQWLQTNVQDIADIIEDEIDVLLDELAQNGEAISA